MQPGPTLYPRVSHPHPGAPTRLGEQLEREGAWLFRHRSYLPVVLFALEIPAIWNHPGLFGNTAPARAWGVGCLLVSLLGLAIRAKTVGHTPRGTSGRNTRSQIAQALNTTGMYSVVRHPLYVGNFFMWLGVALVARSVWLTLVVALAFWLYYERIMLAEEAFLRERFGEGYLEWARRTPAFIPRLSGWQRPTLPFSARTVLRREYSGLLAIVGSIAGLEWIGAWSGGTGTRPDPLWTALLLTGGVVYVLLRTLKRHTRYLHVDGR